MLLLRSLVAVSKRDFAKARWEGFAAREFFYLHLKEIEFRSKIKSNNENLYKFCWNGLGKILAHFRQKYQ